LLEGKPSLRREKETTTEEEQRKEVVKKLGQMPRNISGKKESLTRGERGRKIHGLCLGKLYLKITKEGWFLCGGFTLSRGGGGPKGKGPTCRGKIIYMNTHLQTDGKEKI